MGKWLYVLLSSHDSHYIELGFYLPRYFDTVFYNNNALFLRNNGTSTINYLKKKIGEDSLRNTILPAPLTDIKQPY